MGVSKRLGSKTRAARESIISTDDSSGKTFVKFGCFVFVQPRHAQSRIVIIWRIVASAANEKAMVNVDADDPVQGRQYTRQQVQKLK